MSRTISFLFASLLLVTAACGDDGRGPTFDTGTGDTSVGDTGTMDSGTPDTSTMDSGAGDATMGDATMGDATMGDATMGDATMGDATMGDATMGDAAMDAAPDAMMTGCIDMDLAMATGDSVASGDLTGEGDDGMGSCGSTLGEDMAFTWTAPTTAEYTFDTFGSDADTVLHIHTGAECTADELICVDDVSFFVLQSRVDLMVTAGTTYTIVVDSYDDFSADLFQLNITETSTIPATEAGSCTDGTDNDRDGDIDCFDADCISASACFEVGGACGDGMDNDGDGDVDCADSDCTGYGACLETICDDSMDDDGDGDVDCDDFDCGTDAACDSCPDVDLMMSMATVTGTTAGETNNRAPTTCGAGGGADVTHLFTAPADATYTFDTVGTTFDTVLYVLAVDCRGLELACDDDGGMGTTSSLTVDLAAGQTVVIVVDGYRASASGDYTLNISSATMTFGAPTTAGDLVITEIMQNPRTPDTSNEWFEITNTTSSTLNLNGCNISDLGVDSSDVTGDVVIEPGEYFVFGRTSDVGFTPDYDWSGALALANADDELIITCGGTEIDRVEWDGGTTFPDPDGASMSLDDAATTHTDNDTGSNWCEAPLYITPYDGVNRATPGEANPSCP